MSKLEELIKELCPNGIEYKTIKEVCLNIVSGGTPKTTISSYYNGNVPWLRTQEVNWSDILDTEIKITQEGVNNSSAKLIPANCVIVAMYGATAGKVAINKIPLTTNQACCNLEVDSNKVMYRYVYHWLRNEYISLKSLGRGSQSNINGDIIKNYLIPVPPMEVQREIVRILDNFTELTAELTAELTTRKKQYEYYREKLLNEANTKASESRRFGDIATIVRGASPRPISSFITDKENGINWIKIGDVQPDSKYITQTKEKITLEGAKKSRMVNVGDFILSNSMSFGRPYIMKIQGCIHDGWLAISNFEKYFQSDFLYYLLNSNTIQHEMEQKASNGTVKNLNADIVRNLELPLPPLAEQERIVSILDRFDKLCNDISVGLPAEIEARKKQYEYYRDKLLTFKNIDSEAN